MKKTEEKQRSRNGWDLGDWARFPGSFEFGVYEERGRGRRRIEKVSVRA